MRVTNHNFSRTRRIDGMRFTLDSVWTLNREAEIRRMNLKKRDRRIRTRITHNTAQDQLLWAVYVR